MEEVLTDNLARMHPLVVHFPIALLLIAPFFAIAAGLFKSYRKGLMLATFFLIGAGTVAAFAAVRTGQAAREVLKLSWDAHDVFLEHEATALKVRLIFTILTLIFALTIVLSEFGKGKAIRMWVGVLSVVTIVLYLLGAAAIIKVGHLGARLVHDYNVHNTLTPGFESQKSHNEKERELNDGYHNGNDDY